VKKSVWLLSEVRLSPREVKPCGFVFFAIGKKNGGEGGLELLIELPHLIGHFQGYWHAIY